MPKGRVRRAEPVLGEHGYLTPATPERRSWPCAAWRRRWALPSRAWGVSLWENNLVSDSEATRRKAFPIVQKQIEAAHPAGGRHHSGGAGICGVRVRVKTRKRSAMTWRMSAARRPLARLGPEAAAPGGHRHRERGNRFLLSPVRPRASGRDRSPWGMYLDVGNTVYIGYPEQWVEI